MINANGVEYPLLTRQEWNAMIPGLLPTRDRENANYLAVRCNQIVEVWGVWGTGLTPVWCLGYDGRDLSADGWVLAYTAYPDGIHYR